MKEEIKRRIEKLTENLKNSDIDVALIMQNTDIFYFSGTMPSGVLAISNEGKIVFAIRKGFERAIEETPIEKDNLLQISGMSKLPQILSDREIKYSKIGIETDVLPVDMYFRLKKIFKNSTFVDVSHLIRSIRAIKSPYEIEKMVQSARMLDCIMEDAKELIRAGKKEIEVNVELEFRARKRGHLGRCRMRGFNSDMLMGHVHSGFRSAYPNGLLKPTTGYGLSPSFPDGASNYKIEENAPVIVDFINNYDGYLTDETRTFVSGKLDKEFEKAYDFCCDVMNYLEENAKEGASSLEIYEHCIKMAEKWGYKDNFMGAKGNQVSFIGHGIGLEVDEYPFIAKGADFELKKGMTFAFEPKIAFKGKGAVGIENTYLVKKDGVESLTKYPREIVYV